MNLSNALINLNEQQQEAVLHTESPALVVAGPGSGKTRVITYKVAYLISQKKLEPGRILAITFTKKAAEEMRNRVYRLVGIRSKWISTFHSLCYKILRMHHRDCGLSEDFVIYDEHDSKKLFNRACELVGYDKEHASTLKEKISFHKQYGEITPGVFKLSKERDVYEAYEKMLIDAHAVDFDNLQVFAWRLLKDPAIMKRWANQFDYILIDEFQDTSQIQYDIVRSLTENGNITAVGDPQQSIYGFRGANIKNVSSFMKDYSPHVVKLPLNYRSCDRIVEAANRVAFLFNGEYRDFRVELEAVSDRSGDVVMGLFSDNIEEAEWITQKIQVLLNSIEPEEIAILVRTRYLKNSIRNSLSNAGIVFEDVDEYDLFERQEVKDILSYLNLAYNPKDTVSFMRATHTPPKGIGDRTVEQIEQYREKDYIQALKSYLQKVKGKKAEALYSFLKLMEHIKGLMNNPLQALNEVINLTGYVDYLKKTCRTIDEFEDRYSSIEALRTLMGKCSSYGDFIENFLSRADRKTRRAVKLMTVHSAKGLEFDAVFVPGLEEGIFPHEKADIEEEKRCFYVAVTRARKYLFLTASEYRMRRDNKLMPSGPGVFWTALQKEAESPAYQQ